MGWKGVEEEMCFWDRGEGTGRDGMMGRGGEAWLQRARLDRQRDKRGVAVC